MPIPLLDKFQTNDILKAIQAIGLDPIKFDLDNSSTETRIKLNSSESRFIIGGQVGHYVGRYIFGNNVELRYEHYSWEALMRSVETWLHYVKLDVDTPNLWAELRRETKLLGVGSNEVTENTHFNADEKKEIAGRLRELATCARQTHSLSEAQVLSLGEKVDYLIDASNRLGRKDWLNAFIGVIFGFVLAAALAPETARTMFLTFLRGIGVVYPELSLE